MNTLIATRPSIEIEIVSAMPDRTVRERVRLPANANVCDALAASTLEEARLASHAMRAVDHVAQSLVGIWGRRAMQNAPLADGDRIEIYRELIADAKTARLKRASEQGYRWQGRTRRAAR